MKAPPYKNKKKIKSLLVNMLIMKKEEKKQSPFVERDNFKHYTRKPTSWYHTQRPHRRWQSYEMRMPR